MNLKINRIISSLIIFTLFSASLYAQEKFLGFERLNDLNFVPGNESVMLKFPNGDLKKQNNKWPVGWYLPDLNKICNVIIQQAALKNNIPTPAETAFAMGIPLGEISHLVDRVKPDIFSPPWKDLSENNSIVTIEDESTGVCDSYFHFAEGRKGYLRSPDFDVIANKPHFISMWVRCKAAISLPQLTFWYDAGIDQIRFMLSSLPNTDGEWKRYGIYFRALSDVKRAHFTLFFSGNEAEFLDFGDIKLYQVSEVEFDEAYKHERNEIPAYSPKPSPDDGIFLANSIAKLQGKAGIPGRPFIIWGLGSSWTNGLGNLDALRQDIYRKFPNAPEIVFRKKCGSGSSYTNVLGWVQTQVMIEQPDLIISYTNGSMESLEQLLKIIRQKSTADIIIPSLHLTSFEKGNKPSSIGLNYIDQTVISPSYIEEMKSLCTKYKAQFVDNRKLLFDWLIENKQQPVFLLGDKVHQNRTGVTFTLENVSQHFVESPKPGYDYKEIEENISLTKAFKSKDKRFEFVGDWKIIADQLVCRNIGSSITMKCTGNRLVLVGKKTENGGNLNIKVDGKPSSQVDSYGIGFIKTAITNVNHDGNKYYRSSGANGDASPHGVYLGENIAPQVWTIKMIDNNGNYELIGSSTGADGKGTINEVFKSKSGQIIVDPVLWRAKEKSPENDYWTFDVIRTSVDSISFKKDRKPSEFYTDIFTNFTNTDHTIEIVNSTKGEISIKSLYVCRPILK